MFHDGGWNLPGSCAECPFLGHAIRHAVTLFWLTQLRVTRHWVFFSGMLKGYDCSGWLISASQIYCVPYNRELFIRESTHLCFLCTDSSFPARDASGSRSIPMML